MNVNIHINVGLWACLDAWVNKKCLFQERYSFKSLLSHPKNYTHRLCDYYFQLFSRNSLGRFKKHPVFIFSEERIIFFAIFIVFWPFRPVTHNFSFAGRYSLQIHLLLITRSKITRYSLHKFRKSFVAYIYRKMSISVKFT